MMIEYRKYLLAILMIPLVLSMSCFAEEDGDCSEITKISDYGFISKKRQEDYGNILPKDAVETAVHHLRSYCCEKSMGSNFCSNKAKNYLESPFLFDHIFNIYMRRLDAHYSNGRTKDMIYGLIPDTTGLKWRKFVTEIANKPVGVPPISIVNEYQKNWKITSSDIYLQRRTGDKEYNLYNGLTLKDINREYPTWKLISKYNNACELVSAIYFKLGGKMDVKYKGETYSMYVQGYSVCKNKISQRIIQEKDYIRAMIADKANILIGDYLEVALIDNFSYKRLTELYRKINNMKKYLEEIQRAVIKLVPVCS